MQTTLRDYSRMRNGFPQTALIKGIGWGMLSGLIATLVMDLILMGVLAAAGLAALSCFSIVGNTVARLLSLSGIKIAGSIPLGIAAHYLIGPLMGGGFGAFAARSIAVAKTIAVAKIDAYRLDSLKKVVVLAVLYAEILSQPLLVMAPILLRMTASETLQWFGGSFLMHMIWGCVMGVIWSRGAGQEG